MKTEKEKQNEQVQELQARLFSMQDLKYREFHMKLIPTIDSETIIGVRTPALRKLAKEFSATPEAAEFMKALPHRYYEENNVHAFLLETIHDYDEAVLRLEEFLPYIDNWATCDSLSPKVFSKHLPELLERIRKWLLSEHVYTVRFGLGMLMRHYLDEHFRPEYLSLASSVKSEEYYVKMMIAWYFATALAKQYEATLPYFKEQRLEKWTHNKAIQKAVESFRISPEQKELLRTLKIK